MLSDGRDRRFAIVSIAKVLASGYQQLQLVQETIQINLKIQERRSPKIETCIAFTLTLRESIGDLCPSEVKCFQNTYASAGLGVER